MNKKKKEEIKAQLLKFKELKKIERIPFNIFTLDLLTKGGVPEGKFTLIWGAKSTGKSTVALRLIKSFLEKYPDREACYIDFENTFDPEWAERIVGDTDNLLLAQPAYAEEGIALIQELLENPKIGFYVIDSIACLIPATEVDADADQDFVGLLARMTNKLLRKMIPPIAQWNREGMPITVLLINQLRTDIKKTFVPTHAKPGGFFQEFMASLEIRFYVDKIDKDDEGIARNIVFSFTIEKDKTGAIPKTVGKYVMCLTDTDTYKRGDIIDEPVILDMAKKLGVLVKDKKYYLFGEEFRTLTEIKEKLRNESNFKKTIVQALIKEYWNANR